MSTNSFISDGLQQSLILVSIKSMVLSLFAFLAVCNTAYADFKITPDKRTKTYYASIPDQPIYRTSRQPTATLKTLTITPSHRYTPSKNPALVKTNRCQWLKRTYLHNRGIADFKAQQAAHGARSRFNWMCHRIAHSNYYH